MLSGDQFYELKAMLVESTGLARDAMHIHIGLAVFLVIRILWRGRGGWIVAWIAALMITLSGEYSPYVEPVIQTLRADGLTVSIQKVAYELQRGGNEMLWARHP